MLSRMIMRCSAIMPRAAVLTSCAQPLRLISSSSGRVSEAVADAKKQAADLRAIDTWALQGGAFIAALGGVAIWASMESSKYQDDEDFEAGKAMSAPAPSPHEFREFKLRKIFNVDHNTNIYRFNLATADHKLELPVSSFYLIRAPIGENGKYIVRPYTPISPPGTPGYFDLLIKNYPQGNISRHMKTLKAGDFVEVKGPIKKIQYSRNWKKEIGMIAGGTGITPMLQIIEHSLRDQDDETIFHLVFANKEKRDILLYNKLDGMAKKNPMRVKIHFVLEKAPSGWDGSVGYVSADIVKQYLPPPSDDSMIFVCGPPPMMQVVSGDKAQDKTQGELSGILKDLGYTSENVFKF